MQDIDRAAGLRHLSVNNLRGFLASEVQRLNELEYVMRANGIDELTPADGEGEYRQQVQSHLMRIQAECAEVVTRAMQQASFLEAQTP